MPLILTLLNRAESLLLDQKASSVKSTLKIEWCCGPGYVLHHCSANRNSVYHKTPVIIAEIDLSRICASPKQALQQVYMIALHVEITFHTLTVRERGGIANDQIICVSRQLLNHLHNICLNKLVFLVII